MTSKRIITSVVHGSAVTTIVRDLYCKDNWRALHDCVPHLTSDQIQAIGTGHAHIVGDSEKGFSFEMVENLRKENSDG